VDEEMPSPSHAPFGGAGAGEAAGGGGGGVVTEGQHSGRTHLEHSGPTHSEHIPSYRCSLEKEQALMAKMAAHSEKSAL